MQLKRDSEVMCLSHIFPLVSAYEFSHERLQDLVDQIKEAQEKASTTRTSVIVDQDSFDHILIVHPSKVISLYARMGTYEENEPETI